VFRKSLRVIFSIFLECFDICVPPFCGPDGPLSNNDTPCKLKIFPRAAYSTPYNRRSVEEAV